MSTDEDKLNAEKIQELLSNRQFNGTIPAEKRFRFNGEINLGHIAMIISFFLTIGMIYTKVTDKQDVIEKRVEKLEMANEKLVENQTILTRSTDKLTILIEQSFNKQKP